MKLYIIKEHERQYYIYAIGDGEVGVQVVEETRIAQRYAATLKRDGYISYESAIGGTLPRDPEKRDEAIAIFSSLKADADIGFFSYGGAECWFAPSDAWDEIVTAFKPEHPTTPLVSVKRWSEVSRKWLPWDPKKAIESQ